MVELKILGQLDLVKFELDVQGPVWFSIFLWVLIYSLYATSPLPRISIKKKLLINAAKMRAIIAHLSIYNTTNINVFLKSMSTHQAKKYA